MWEEGWVSTTEGRTARCGRKVSTTEGRTARCGRKVLTTEGRTARCGRKGGCQPLRGGQPGVGGRVGGCQPLREVSTAGQPGHSCSVHLRAVASVHCSATRRLCGEG